jgi:hypothetical protein
VDNSILAVAPAGANGAPRPLRPGTPPAVGPVRLTATNEEREPSRLARLTQVLGRAAERLAGPGRSPGAALEILARRVETLSDHKGELSISWRSQPTATERGLFARAWEALDEDGRAVTHVWPGGRMDPPRRVARRRPTGGHG